MPDTAPPLPSAAGASPADTPLLHLEGFEGPLDLLLELARGQQVDLARISVLSLVDQYLVATEELVRSGAARLEQAADWLVMAAWLTWLKSRLLLPRELAEAREAERAATALTDRLLRLERARRLAAWLDARPQVGRDVAVRGAPENLAPDAVTADLAALLEACLVGLRPRTAARAAVYRPLRPVLWTVPEAIARLRARLAEAPAGGDLLRFLPDLPADGPDLPLRRRAALASTLAGALELARSTELRLEQAEVFGRIRIAPTAISRGE